MTSPPDAPAPGADALAGDSSPWLARGLLAVVLLACAIPLSPSMADPDLWGHVQYGRDALADGLPATTTYSFTTRDYPWINHENLSELALAVTADALGPAALLTLKCLLGLLVLGLMVRHARKQRVRATALGVVLFLVAVNLSYYWSLRPQVFSFTLFALLVALISWCFAGWEGRWHLPWRPAAARSQRHREPVYASIRLRWLWLAVPLFGIWANTHGAFVAGLAIFAAILGCRGLEALFTRGRGAHGLLARLAMMLAAAGLVTLLNPYGPRLHAWLLHSLGQPRPEIVEWGALDLGSAVGQRFLLLAAVAMTALLLSRKPLDVTQLVVLGLTAWQTTTHARHVPFFAILCGFWLPAHLQGCLASGRSAATRNVASHVSPRERKFALATLGVMAAALLAILAPRLRAIQVDRGFYAVRAFQYIADRDLEGRMLVSFEWAQYAIAAFGSPDGEEPGLQVAFDGRFRTCYPQQVVDIHFDFLQGNDDPTRRHRGADSPPPRGARALEHGQPDLVLIHRGWSHAGMVMEAHRDEWVRLYQDGLAQLWGRRTLYDDPQRPTYIAPADRDVSDAPQEGFAAWPALPIRATQRGGIAAR